jgi:magnesium transporter
MANPLPDDVKRIHQLKRDLLTVRRAVWPQREMLSGMIRDDSPLVQEQTKLYLRDCFDHTFQLMDLIETYREIVSDLTDIFLSAQSTRMNEVMKVLTVIATIFMPLTVLTGMYGMNVALPDFPGGDGVQFWWIFGIMLTVSVVMLWLFRRMRWL